MSGHRPVGWEPMQAEWWPAIAATIVRPWPREAVLFDLRWWRGQERATGRKLMPGRPALQERWGLGEWDARKLLRAEAEWCDPKHRKAEEPGKLSSGSPATLQSPSSVPPAQPTANAANVPESSSNPPAALQQLSSDSPSRAILLSTDTPSTAHRAHTDMSAAPLFAQPATPEAPPPAAPAPKPKPPPADEAEALAVWAAWKETHRGCKATPPADVAKLIRAALKEHGAETVIAVVRWTQTADHSRARYLRGERNGQMVPKEAYGLDTIMRHVGSYDALRVADEAALAASPRLSALPPGMKPRGPVVIDAESGRVEVQPEPRKGGKPDLFDMADWLKTIDVSAEGREGEEDHAQGN